VPDRIEENHQIPSYEITSFWTEISNRKAPSYTAKVFSTQPHFSIALITSRSTFYFSGILLSLPVPETLKKELCNTGDFDLKATTAFHLVNEWLNTNFLHINLSKTHFMQFTRSNRPKSYLPTTHLNKLIQSVSNTKFFWYLYK